MSGYGEWEVRLQGCNDTGCGPEASQTVELSSLHPPGEPENFAVSATPGSLDLSAWWQEVDGATSYKLRWRQADGQFEAANAATVSGAPIGVITVSGYGEWEVRLQGCNDAGCGPEAVRTVDVLPALPFRLEQARDDAGQVRPRTFNATWDPVEGAASYTLRWWRVSENPQAAAPSQPEAERQTRSGANSSARERSALADRRTSGDGVQGTKDQGVNQLTVPGDRTSADFSVPGDGEYEAELQANGDGNEVIAKSENAFNQADDQTDTTPPRVVRGEIDGKVMTLYFSEPLDEDATGGRFYVGVQPADCWCWAGGDVDAPMEISGNRVTLDFRGRHGKLRAVEGLGAATAYLAKPDDPTSLRDLAGNRVRTPYSWYSRTTSTRYIGLVNITGRPFVTGVAISSEAGIDRSYVDGETVRVKLTFGKAVDVTGTPRLKIDLDPEYGGERWADYASGSGTKMLEFAYTVVAEDLSTHGVAVLQNTLELNGGAISSAWGNARLAHTGLSRDSSHKVGRFPPTLLQATVDGATLTLTFSEPLAAAASLANSAFTVKKTPQAGSEETVSLSGSPAIEGTVLTLTLTLANAVLDTDTDVKVSYDKPASGANNKLIDAAGHEAESFSDEPVVNLAGDTTPPRLVRGEINDDAMTLYFSEPLDVGSVGGHFYVLLHPSLSGKSIWFTTRGEVQISDNTVVVVLGSGARRRASVGGAVWAYYYKPLDPNAQTLRDPAGNEVWTPHERSSGHPRTRTIVLTNRTGQQPSPERATVRLDQLTLTFDKALDGDSVPADGAFTVKANDSVVSLASANPVAVSGRTVTLTLASAVAQGDVVSVSYAKPASSPLKGVDGAVKSFPHVSATNLTGVPSVSGVAITSDPGDDDTYALGEAIRVTATFSEAVDATGAPRLKIKMDPEWGEFWADYESGSGTEELIFAYTVVEPNTSPGGIAAPGHSLDLNGGAIRSTSAQTDGHLWYAGLGHDPGHKVNWRLASAGVPSVSGVAVTSDPGDDDTYALGETIRVTATFSEAVDVTGAPRLKIKMDPDGREFWADYASGSGTTSLVFVYQVVEPNTSPGGIAAPGHSLDLNGGAIRSTATQTDAHLWYAGLGHDPGHKVNWRLASAGVPSVSGVAITSDPGDDDTYALGETIRVTVAFSEAMNVTGTPRLKIRMGPDLWWLGADDEVRRADYAGGSGTNMLTFNYTVRATNHSTQGVAVLRNGLDLNGGAILTATGPPTYAHLRYERLWHDRDHQVDGEAPSLLTVAVAGTRVALTYDEALDENSVPPASAFTVQRTPQGSVAETVGLSGTPVIAAGAVILTLAGPVVGTDTDVKVSYSQPAAPANRLRDKAGNEASGFTDQAAEPTDTTPPRLVKGEIDGNTMTIHFSEALDENWTGEGGKFKITVHVHDWSRRYGQCPGGNHTFTASPREVYVNGNTAVVVGLWNDSLKGALVESMSVIFYYYADVSVAKRLRDLSGNPVHTPDHREGNYWRTERVFLENVTWLPSPERATVIGDRLTLAFDAPLDGGWRPAASAFTVTVNGSAVSLADANAVAMSGRTVTLTLATAVAAGDDVTVELREKVQQLAAEPELRIRRELLRRTREQLYRGVPGDRGHNVGSERRRHLRSGRRHPRAADLQRGGERDRASRP